MSLSTEPTTRADMIAHYKAVKERLNVQPKPAKTVPVRAVPIGEIHRYAPRPLVYSYGSWIVGKTMPLIPWHLQNRIKRIQQVVAKEFGVKLDEMYSERRTARLVMARQVAMWFCKEWTVHSYPEIGEKFGGRDHTTVIHACRQIEKKRLSDPDLSDAIDRIIANLNIPGRPA
jgi:hypothetical protein